MLAHGLDYDDTHTAGVIHLTVGILPALLAWAEANRIDDGREFVAAYVAAVEAGARIAAAAQGGFHAVGFHPTGLVGAFAAALGAGRLARLDAQQLADAQGIALSVGAGSLQFLDDGAWTKRLHPGWAAVGGLTAAALARAGFPAPRAVYEGRFGLYASHIGERTRWDLSLVTRALGEAWELMNVAVKPYPLCHLVHACTDAAVALSAEVRGRDIVRVVARVPAGVVPVVCEPLAAKRTPRTDYDAKFSLPYCVATGLLRGKLGLAELRDEALADPAVRALMAKVEYVADPGFEYPRYYGGAVEVTLADGRVLTKEEPINRGSAERPLTDAEVVAKFRDNASALPPPRIDRIVEAMLGIEQGGVRALLTALAA
jgi:2-methylcitrate dehydratase PrpD